MHDSCHLPPCLSPLAFLRCQPVRGGFGKQKGRGLRSEMQGRIDLAEERWESISGGEDSQAKAILGFGTFGGTKH